MSYRREFNEHWTVLTNITPADGTTTLVPAPAAGQALMVQVLTVALTTSAAQAFDVESANGAVEVFKAPASLAVGTYGVDVGPVGVALPEAQALQYTATAGVGVTLSGFGYVRKL